MHRGLALLLLLAAPLSCERGSATMLNPLVRVNLRHALPGGKRFTSRLPSALELDCHEKIPVVTDGVSHDFVANWRVLDLDGSRYIVAVDVQPSGSIMGGTAPSASASVGQLTRRAEGKGTVDEVPLIVSLQAQKGCNKVSKTVQHKVRSDHASCKSPAPKNLLK